MEIPPGNIFEMLGDNSGEVTGEVDGAFGFHPHFRPTQKVVGNHQTEVIVDNANQPS